MNTKDWVFHSSVDQLKRMARFANYFNEKEISAQAVHQIPWSTIIELMRLSSFKEEALWVNSLDSHT